MSRRASWLEKLMDVFRHLPMTRRHRRRKVPIFWPM